MSNKIVTISPAVRFGNDLPFVLIGGMNVIEGRNIVLEVAEQFRNVSNHKSSECYWNERSSSSARI